MKRCQEQHLESALTARCGRMVRVSRCPNGAICVVLEPTGDRGRVELIATGSGHRWTVSDRGAVGELYGLDLDFVIAKLSAFGTSLSRRGGELVARSDDRSVVEAVAEFVDSIEFVPVLAGLFATEVADGAARVARFQPAATGAARISDVAHGRSRLLS